MDYIRAMEGIHTSKKHFLPYIQKHTSIVRFTARSLNSGDRIHNIHKELKLKKKQSGKNFVNNVSLPKQILFQHLSDILNDINLNADDSGDLSLFEQYRQSGLVAIVINGEIVVKKRSMKTWVLSHLLQMYFPVFGPTCMKTLGAISSSTNVLSGI
jgi:hypothetical protein